MLRIVGDICFSDGFFDQGFGIGKMLREGINPLENIPFNKKDIWFGNLECVVSNISNKSGVDAMYFRVNEADFLKTSHCDVYAVANNHIMQHGSTAYLNTLKTVSKVAKFVGSNDNRSILIENDGSRYGILVFSMRAEIFSKDILYWSKPELVEIEEEFEKIKYADCKVVYMHWGNEFINYPNVAQKKFAHWLVDIGFDVIVGCHPHILQGYEVYKEKYIFYSIGNFLFNMPTLHTRNSAIINISCIDKRIDVTYDYVKIHDNNMPYLISVDEVPKDCTFEYLNTFVENNDDNEVYYLNMFKSLSQYRKLNHKWMIKTLHKHKISELLEMIFVFIKRRIR